MVLVCHEDSVVAWVRKLLPMVDVPLLQSRPVICWDFLWLAARQVRGCEVKAWVFLLCVAAVVGMPHPQFGRRLVTLR